MKPGLTLRSFFVGLFAVVLMAMYIQCVEVLLADPSVVAEQALPAGAMVLLVGLALLSAGLHRLTQRRLLEREELFCVLMWMLIATPIMTQGMWHRFIGLIAATPRTQSFAYLDALSDKLWPHGENLLAGRLTEDEPALQTRGQVTWTEAEIESGDRRRVPLIRHTQETEVSEVVFALPLTADSNRGIVPGEPYLVSLLVRGEGFAPSTRIFCRAYAGADDRYDELFSSTDEQRVTFLHQTGFVRLGRYGVSLPDPGTDTLRIAVGLSGRGSLWMADPKLFSVAALEMVYTGRRIVSADEWDALPPGERVGLVVRPARWFSLEGLRFILSGYIPLQAWWQPAFSWAALVLLLLGATFAIGVLMRRQWADNQRYQFPTFQIPLQLLGEPGTTNGEHGLAPVWRNPVMWWGAGVSLLWALMRGWHFFNPAVPDLSVEVPLGQYLSDPGWGGMWQVTFTVSAILLAMCLFLELNVLLSLLVGFLLYRSLFWVGHGMGWDATFGFPFRYEQAVGAYLGYAAIVLVVSWRYLLGLGRAVARGRWPDDTVEALSPRVALLLLVGSFVGAVLWAYWLEVSPLAILLFFAFLVTIGFVSAKLRAECGTPYGYFTPYNAMLFVGLLGGMSFFGAEAMMVCLIASGFLTVSVFFYGPGLQVELIEFGRRYAIQPRHLVMIALLGVLSGLFIGGWVFLSNAYALGGESIKYQWAFNQDWFFSSYRQELSRATAQFLGQTAGAVESGGIAPSIWAYLYGGAGAVVVTVLRQVLSGFWFHPIGFILGSSHFIEAVWGSALVAWVIKLTCLKLGGAEFYRRKLVPLAVGILLGAIASILVFNVHSAWLRSQNIELNYGALP